MATFSETLVRMWPFSSKAPEELEPAPPENAEQRYRQAQIDLAMAKQARDDADHILWTYNSTYTPDLRTAAFNGRQATCIGAMEMYPERRALERDCREKQQQFALANEEFAKAKKAAGLASY